jgi:MFS family permease
MIQIFKHPVYTPQFGLLCLSSYLFYASFNMLIPELPAYLSSLGGADYKGFIIALFTLTAGLSRPFSGKLADKVGRVPVMLFGTGVCFVCGFFYPVAATVSGFLLLRLIHGFSTGFQPTGTSAYVADITPLARRGEAIGFHGLAGSLGMASGPAIGSAVTNAFSLSTMFYLSSAFALASVLVLAGLRETAPARERFSWRLLRIGRHEILETRVLAPALVMFLVMFSYGVVLTLVPDLSGHLGIRNKGLFFTCFTLASLGVRFVAGRVSDKYGRVPVLKVSTLILAGAMGCVSLAASPVVFLLGAVLFGIGSGMSSPTLYAWTIDLSDEAHRGRAMGTTYIALEAGIGTSALLAGWLYGNDSARLPQAFWLAAALAIGAFAFLQLQHRGRKA